MDPIALTVTLELFAQPCEPLPSPLPEGSWYQGLQVDGAEIASVRPWRTGYAKVEVGLYNSELEYAPLPESRFRDVGNWLFDQRNVPWEAIHDGCREILLEPGIHSHLPEGVTLRADSFLDLSLEGEVLVDWQTIRLSGDLTLGLEALEPILGFYHFDLSLAVIESLAAGDREPFLESVRSQIKDLIDTAKSLST